MWPPRMSPCCACRRSVATALGARRELVRCPSRSPSWRVRCGARVVPWRRRALKPCCRRLSPARGPLHGGPSKWRRHVRSQTAAPRRPGGRAALAPGEGVLDQSQLRSVLGLGAMGVAQFALEVSGAGAAMRRGERLAEMRAVLRDVFFKDHHWAALGSKPCKHPLSAEGPRSERTDPGLRGAVQPWGALHGPRVRWRPLSLF